MIHRSLLAIAAVTLAAPVAAQKDDLTQVATHLKLVSTMTASFAQSDKNGKTMTGTLTLKQPGKIRFQYQPSVPILIVGDGKALTFVDYSVKQVSRWPIGNSPLAVLLDPAKDISRFTRILPQADDRIVLAEARRNGASLPVTALVDQFYSDVQKLGGKRWDTSSLLARLEV